MYEKIVHIFYVMTSWQILLPSLCTDNGGVSNLKKDRSFLRVSEVKNFFFNAYGKK